MALHVTLPPSNRTASGDHNGRWVPVAGRIQAPYPWTVTVDCGSVQTGTVAVRLEGALRRSEEEATTLHTFATLSTPARLEAEVTVSGYLSQGFLRAVANINGQATLGVTARARFFSPTAEFERIDRQLQEWDRNDSFASLAERDLIEPYRRGDHYALAMDRPGFHEDARNAIALQLRRRFELDALGKSANPADRVSLRELATVDAGAQRLIRNYASSSVVHF